MDANSLDPKIIAALVGLLAALVSAIVSYFVSKHMEDRKNTIKYLGEKIAILEKAKGELVELGFKSMGESLNKENFIERYSQSARNKFSRCSKRFKLIDHYLNDNERSLIREKISKIDIALGAEGLEEIAERQIPASLIGAIPRDSQLTDQLTALSDNIVRIIDEELRASVVKIESMSGLE